MALVAKTLTLDITPGSIPQVVNVSEYDENREYTVTLIDDGGVFEIPSGTTATVDGSIGGNAFSESATVSGNTITFTLSESMTALAGDAWCKIKLTKDSKPIQTCAFILRCDRAGAEAETVIGADGFKQQIINAVNNWLDLHPPSGGTGLSDEVKQALLDCFENVAWINDQGQTYYDALYAALYPPSNLVSISAAFNQGSATIYDTDSLDTLKQYLVVTAHYDNQTTQTISNYALSGTLTEGTSVITVSYGGKSATFNVIVTDVQMLYFWNLKDSFVDSKQGAEITDMRAVTRSASGAYFEDCSSYLTLPSGTFAKGRRIEVDYASGGTWQTAGRYPHGAVIGIANTIAYLMWRNGDNKYEMYVGAWQDVISAAVASNKSFLDGNTLVLECDSNGTVTVGYISNGVETTIGTCQSTYSSESGNQVLLGKTVTSSEQQQSMFGVTVTAVRIFEI